MNDPNTSSYITGPDGLYTYLHPVGPMIIGASIAVGVLSTAASPLIGTSSQATTITPYRGRAPRAVTQTPNWPKPSVAIFVDLSARDPDMLIDMLLHADMTPGLRARGAEAAGRIASHHLVVDALMQLLEHSDPVVREASIYGLERHLTPLVCARLRKIVEDPATTRGVREAAIDALALVG